MKINNYDSGATPTVGAPKYYTGQVTTHSAQLVIDLVKPVHCSVGSTCTDNMLDRGQPITKSVSGGHFLGNESMFGFATTNNDNTFSTILTHCSGEH